MDTLQLNLKGRWFDMVYSGEKREEYREIKEGIVSLLFDWRRSGMTRKEFTDNIKGGVPMADYWPYLKYSGKATIRFSNGYRRDRRWFVVRWPDITIGTGKCDWGAVSGKRYFVLELGEITNSGGFKRSMNQ